MLGFGVDEKSFVSILGKWNAEQRQSYRKSTPEIFLDDKRQFKRWNERHLLLLQQEFMRLMVLFFVFKINQVVFMLNI